MSIVEAEKFRIQDKQYEFPYHYIPHIKDDGTPSLSRRLNWGLEYLCYQNHLIQTVTQMKPRSVLEAGCGDGYFLGALPMDISLRVGVDLSEKAIAFAKAFHPDCTFHVRDVGSLNEKFDVVAAIEVLEHIPDDIMPSFLNALSDRLEDEGRIVVSVPTVVLPLNRKHYRHYTVDVLHEHIVESGAPLEIERVEYIYSRPWWFGMFKRAFDNRLFSIEIKPLMRRAWRSVWKKHRYADAATGFHMIAYLKKR